MKKTLLLLFFITILSLSVFAEGMLGLRTITATKTEDEASGTTQQETSMKLNLRTVDPLLQSFRDGFKTPDLPGWTVVKIGEKSFKVPNGFTLSVVNNGGNYDAQILDENRKQFAQLFMYQIESYELEELYDALMQTLYGEAATEKAFEEFKEYDNDLIVYFTNQLNTKENDYMPLFFIYTKDKDRAQVKEGTAFFLFVEPFEYQTMEDPTYINPWVEGIAASLIEAMEDKEADVKTIEKGADKDSFGAWVRDSIRNNDLVDSLPQGWTEMNAQYFTIFHPIQFKAESYMGESFEVVDFDYNGVTVSKIFYGYSEEEVSISSAVEEVYETYLSGLGDYSLARETAEMMANGYLVTYELDFDDLTCWITIFSEAEKEGVLNGDYILFLGISPEGEEEAWKVIYHTMLLSGTF